MSKKLLYEYLAKYPGNKLDEWITKVRLDNKVKLDTIKENLIAQGLHFRGRVLKGESGKKIVELAHREKANLIIMGKRGLGLVDRMLIGSTTLKVLRESKIPVLAVKKMDTVNAVDIRNILVPIDIYEKADSALNYAMDLAERTKARVSVVYVFSLYAYDYEMPHSLLRDLIKFSSDELERRVDEIKLQRGIQLEINKEVIHGISPAISIVDYASSKNIDLIVINTHGRKGIKRFILGSVTEKVVQNSPCSVLVLKP